MHTVSNKQMEDIIKYVEIMCETLQGNDTKTYNTKRLAHNLVKHLKAKQPFSASELRIIKNNS